MSQAKNTKKFRIAGSSAYPAAVDARWFEIRRFGSNPEKGDSFLSPNNNASIFTFTTIMSYSTTLNSIIASQTDPFNPM